MSRRPHQKSKKGCAACKTRHIKCDERRPSCINCQTTDFTCSFLNEPGIPLTAPSSPAASSTEDRSSQDGKVVAEDRNASAVNMDHLRLFYQFPTKTVCSLSSVTVDLERSFQMVMRCALSTPYLMHEMLVLAALHLSILESADQDSYRRQATELQQGALRHFNDSDLEITSSSCIPMFLFSSFLGIHLLCDTLRYRDETLSNFFNRFSHYLNLHRRVRSITNNSWALLRQSELAPWLDASKIMAASTEFCGNECSRLRSRIYSSEITPVSMKAYEEAIEHLRSIFDSQARTQHRQDGVHLVFAWPVIVPAEYSNLLSQRRAEALIILAHYAVLLHTHRWLWLIGDGGEFLIRSISRALGDAWAECLEWPLSVLEANA